MRRSLYAKFWLTYALFALLGFFVISTLISQLTLAKRTELKADDLYREANYISSNFVRSYYSGRSSSSLEPIHTQFQALDVYLNASIWLLDNNGRILVNSKENLNLEEPDIIEESNESRRIPCIAQRMVAFQLLQPRRSPEEIQRNTINKSTI